MGIEWIDPWEKPLHEIYEKESMFITIPSLAIHCANINSVFGLSPIVDWKKFGMKISKIKKARFLGPYNIFGLFSLLLNKLLHQLQLYLYLVFQLLYLFLILQLILKN